MFTVGAMSAGSSQSVTFIVRVDPDYIVAHGAVSNLVIIGDDGVSGPETSQNNNTSTLNVPSQPLAVTLSRFRAVRQSDGSIRISWITLSERNTVGFGLVRAPVGSGNTVLRASATRVTRDLLGATGQSGGGYSFIDTSASASARYAYWLIETEADGIQLEYGPARVEQTTGIFLPLVTR